MTINADFDTRVVVHSEELDWIDSPVPGVVRRPLDRVGGEVARATSIVRYAPGSKFSSHIHTGGEEFLVLDGVFQDEHGDFPKGSYIRNPPRSSHTPGSEAGCTIFVKLWQFEANDLTHVRLNSNFMQAVPHRDQPRVDFISLYIDQHEAVSIQYWRANAEIELPAPKGLELLVIEGEMQEGGENLHRHSWLRLPIGSTLRAKVGDQGVKVWVKLHHLSRVASEVERVTFAANAAKENS